MYSARFESDNGLTFIFGKDGGNVFDMDLGSGVSVDIGTSQGFSQIGETVETLAVNGRPIAVKGVLFKDIDNQKKNMRKIFAPFIAGKLIFEDGYYTRVYVQDPPSFSSVKKDGRFTMQLFAPFPYFYSSNEIVTQIGGITPMFRFPVNYSGLHAFGILSRNKISSIYNDSDIKVPYSVIINVVGTSTNPTVTNLETFEFLKINGEFKTGDVINVFRDIQNVLIANVTDSDGNVTDIISRIDDSSTFFELSVGENLISVVDDYDNGYGMNAQISFKPVVVALYES